MVKRRNIKAEQEVAKARILKLFLEADQAFSEEPELSHKYIGQARKIAMKYKVRIPSDLQKKFCKHCYHYLMPGINCTVRVKRGKVIYSCLDCKKFMRFPIK